MHDDACGAPRMRRVREDQRALGPSTAIRMTQLPNIDRHHSDRCMMKTLTHQLSRSCGRCAESSREQNLLTKRQSLHENTKGSYVQ